MSPLRGPNLDLHHRLADQTTFVQRPKPQDRHSGVAAYPADIPGPPYLLPMELRQAIDELTQPLRVGMTVIVPPLVGCRIAQAKVARKVDNALGYPGEVIDPLPGSPMGQRQKEQIAWL